MTPISERQRTDITHIGIDKFFITSHLGEIQVAFLLSGTKVAKTGYGPKIGIYAGLEVRTRSNKVA